MEELCQRFANKGYENAKGEFSKLQQSTTVKAYQEQFETLRALILSKHGGLNEQFFVNNFLSGLKEKIRHTVQMFSPKTLTHVYSLAKLREAA